MKFARKLFPILVLMTFLLSGFFVFRAVININHTRQKKSAELFSLAKSEIDTTKKIIYLIQSDTLASSPDKKILLAKTYYESGQKEKAISELKKINCREDFRACDYLAELGEIEYAAKNNNLAENLNAEFKIIKQISQGKFDAISGYNKAPQTNTLKLMQAINLNNYSELKDQTYINNKLNNLAKNAKNNQLILYLGNYFLEIDQPNLSIYVLEKSNLEVYDTHLIKSQAFYRLGDYEKSYMELLAAIEKDPANLDLYKKIFEVSKKLENPENLNLLKQNYQRIINLTRT